MAGSGTALSCVTGCCSKCDVSRDRRFDRRDKTLCGTITRLLEVRVYHTERQTRESGKTLNVGGDQEPVSYSNSNQEIGIAAGKRTSQTGAAGS